MVPTIILGGAGFIGSLLAQKLQGMGKEIIVIDRFKHFDSKKFAEEIESERCQIIEADISKVEILDKVLPAECESIFHLAANSDIKPGPNFENIDFNDTLCTTLALAETLKNKVVKHVVFASSSAVFGNAGLKVSSKSHVHNSLSPISNYGLCKLMSEYILESLYYRGNIEQLSVCRFPNVVGRNVTHGILYDFFRKSQSKTNALEVLGNGYQEKPYLHVDNLIDILVEVEGEIRSELNYFNIGPKDTISVREIVNLFIELTGWIVKVSYQDSPIGWPGDVAKYSFNSDNFKTNILNSRESVQKAITELTNDKRFS